MWRRIGVVAFVASFAIAQSTQRFPRDGLILSAEEIGSPRECWVDNEGYSIYFLLNLRVTNKSARPVCVPKHLAMTRLIVAKSAKDLRSGNYELDSQPDPVGSAVGFVPPDLPTSETEACTSVDAGNEITIQETTPPLPVRLKGSTLKSQLSAGSHVMVIEVSGTFRVLDSRASTEAAGKGATLKSNAVKLGIPQRDTPPAVCKE
jgi:hypothetical protein